jgi:hypothetical protein
MELAAWSKTMLVEWSNQGGWQYGFKVLSSI